MENISIKVNKGPNIDIKQAFIKRVEDRAEEEKKRVNQYIKIAEPAESVLFRQPTQIPYDFVCDPIKEYLKRCTDLGLCPILSSFTEETDQFMSKDKHSKNSINETSKSDIKETSKSDIKETSSLNEILISKYEYNYLHQKIKDQQDLIKTLLNLLEKQNSILINPYDHK